MAAALLPATGSAQVGVPPMGAPPVGAPPVGAAQVNRYLVLFPSLTPSGRYAGDYDIYLSDIFDDGTREFLAEQPKKIAAQAYREFAPVAIPDGAGGAFLAYTIEHNDSAHQGDRDILMRRIDRMGNDVWGDSSSHIVVIAQSKYAEENPQLVQGADGGIVVLYEVRYGPQSDTGDVDVAAVKIEPNGTPSWSSGIWIANTQRRERLRGSVTDGLGGAVAVVEISTSRDTTITGADIYAMHADRYGKVAWGASAAPLAVAASKHLERNPAVVSDGFGGAYVAYELAYTSGDRIGDVDILAQHISSYGVREWTDPSALPIVSSNEKAREHSPSISLDSAGVIVSFEVNIVDKQPLALIGVQRMDHLGKATWNLGRKATLVGAPGMLASHPRTLPLPGGGAYLLFEGRDSVTGNKDIFAQRLSPDGDLVWGSGDAGIPVFNSIDAERDAAAAVDGVGGLMVVAAKDHPTPDGLTASDIVAQRVAADGTLLWKDIPGPLMLTNTSMLNLAPVLVRSN